MKNLAILVWCVPPDGPTATQATRFANELTRRYERFSVVYVVEARAGVPTPEGRDALMAAARETQAQLACAGVHLPSSPLLASLLQSFVRVVGTLMRGKITLIVERELPTLVRRVVESHNLRSELRISPSELLAGIRETRALACDSAANVLEG